jgi:(p)ppGpp synthase/HD superfamily hydrolase
VAISSEEADVLAARLLGDLRTRLGGLEIAHARRVAARLRGTSDDRVIAAALLHDVLEKAGVSADELRAMTGDAGVVALVEVLSRRDGESEHDYLSRCAADPKALVVKRVDLADKLVADDSAVPTVVAEKVRQEARERLALLDGLAPPR